jgi:hypothetical protein
MRSIDERFAKSGRDYLLDKPNPIPLPFDEAVKAALEVPPPKSVERAKKARVTSRLKRKKS